jgi:DNA-directed RNA polymerase subunit RPC12/RpoP
MIKCPDCGFENCNGCPTYDGICHQCGKNLDEYLKEQTRIKYQGEKKDGGQNNIPKNQAV